MKLGMNTVLSHSSPDEWAQKTRALGCMSTVFPTDYHSKVSLIDEYVRAARENGLVIAEVGVWRSPLADDENARRLAMESCREQLKLADYVGARCCVNVTGARGERWDGPYQENFSPEFYDRIVELVRRIIDEARPVNTFYTIEPMPWMAPSGPGEYERLLKDVDRKQFGVHMDLANWICTPKRYLQQERFIDKVFKRLGNRMKSCHLKDVHLNQEYTFRVEEKPCGMGELKLEYFLEGLNRINPDIPVLIEHLHSEQEYMESFCYVQNRMSKAGLV